MTTPVTVLFALLDWLLLYEAALRPITSTCAAASPCVNWPFRNQTALGVLASTRGAVTHRVCSGKLPTPGGRLAAATDQDNPFTVGKAVVSCATDRLLTTSVTPVGSVE